MITSEKLVIVSGHFNPLHGGHLDMMEAGAAYGELMVIVKNDQQQVEKKGKVIRPENERLRLVRSLSVVSLATLAVDSDDTVVRTLEKIAEEHPDREIIFGNGGTTVDSALIAETSICNKLGIKMIIGLGGYDKTNSSTDINVAMWFEQQR